MLVRRPTLLVCDDLSSALDVETEQALWERVLSRPAEPPDGRPTVLVCRTGAPPCAAPTRSSSSRTASWSPTARSTCSWRPVRRCGASGPATSATRCPAPTGPRDRDPKRPSGAGAGGRVDGGQPRVWPAFPRRSGRRVGMRTYGLLHSGHSRIIMRPRKELLMFTNMRLCSQCTAPASCAAPRCPGCGATLPVAASSSRSRRLGRPRVALRSGPWARSPPSGRAPPGPERAAVPGPALAGSVPRLGLVIPRPAYGRPKPGAAPESCLPAQRLALALMHDGSPDPARAPDPVSRMGPYRVARADRG